jgi:hypothetical protein
MKLLGFEFSFDEIMQIANAISQHINRDALCLLLQFSNEFIRDWYNEINTMITPLIIKGGFKNLTEKKSVLYSFITKSTYFPIDNTSFLRDGCICLQSIFSITFITIHLWISVFLKSIKVNQYGIRL